LFFLLTVCLPVFSSPEGVDVISVKKENQIIQSDLSFDAGKPEASSPADIRIIDYSPRENNVQKELFTKFFGNFPVINDLNVHPNYSQRVIYLNDSNQSINLFICILRI
jgi:hypothetical protein